MRLFLSIATIIQSFVFVSIYVWEWLSCSQEEILPNSQIVNLNIDLIAGFCLFFFS